MKFKVGDLVREKVNSDKIYLGLIVKVYKSGLSGFIPAKADVYWLCGKKILRWHLRDLEKC